MNKNSERLKQIIETYTDPWKDLTQFREILLDFFPDDKICRNLLYISAEERIPQFLRRMSECDLYEIEEQRQRLMNASGCTRLNAVKIVYMWTEVFSINVKVDKNLQNKNQRGVAAKFFASMALPKELTDEENWDGEEEEMGYEDFNDEILPGGLTYEEDVEGEEDFSEDETISSSEKQEVQHQIIPESTYTEFNHPGRDVCDLLRDVRKKIAEKNGIKYEFEECHHTGPCKGTCPACEAELRYLEAELKKKIDRGEKVYIEGLASAELEEYIKNNKKKSVDEEIHSSRMGRLEIHVPPFLK